MGKNRIVVHGASTGQEQANAQNESKVTHTVDQESLHIGKDGCLALVVKANQQIRNNTYRLPAKEELQQVITHDQHEHGKRKQGDIGEEAVVALLLCHIANSVNVHH